MILPSGVKATPLAQGRVSGVCCRRSSQWVGHNQATEFQIGTEKFSLSTYTCLPQMLVWTGKFVYSRI